jgi:hypothetical protein
MCFKIKIIQIFPVRGHSYCECDRNLANFSKFIKKIEKIESSEVYINFLKESNFDVNKGVSYNFANFLKPYFKPLKNYLFLKLLILNIYVTVLLKFMKLIIIFQ